MASVDSPKKGPAATGFSPNKRPRIIPKTIAQAIFVMNRAPPFLEDVRSGSQFDCGPHANIKDRKNRQCAVE